LTVSPVLLATALISLVAAGADPRARLEALKAQKAAEERAVQFLSQREGSLLDALAEADAALVDAENKARATEVEHGAAAGRLKEAQQAEGVAQARLEALRSELVPRLAARARAGRIGELAILVSAPSLDELVKRRYLLARIQSHDLAMLAAARTAAAEQERARRVRQSEARRLAGLDARAQADRASAVALREERVTLLGAIRDARALHERTAVELAGQEEKLAEFISALPPSRAGAVRHSGFAALRGKLPHPADGPTEVGFGKVVNPRFNTVTVQKGIDLRAPLGAAVRAVAPGRVVHAGWFKGYGNLVIVDHGDGYHTLVAHLQSMSTAMGEEVEAGAPLGTVGETASLKGPYLYFEIREHGRSVDPGQWLAP
jgi:septal ring factor EnvC (AmiA/AmiB activator)